MAKDPAFLFYPNDWLGGTMGMTFEEKGAYMELLMLQFNRGHMTTHMIGQTVGQIFGQIEDKFKKDEAGLWYNERLDIEKQKRQSFTESRRNNIKGKNQHTKKTGHNKGHMTAHMENEDVNENVIDNVVVIEKIKNMCDFFKFSEMSFPQQFFAASEFIHCLVARNQIDHFDKQFLAYQKLKKKDGFTHSFKNFIGTPELFYEDGAWNSENWETKVVPKKFDAGANTPDMYEEDFKKHADWLRPKRQESIKN